MTLALLLAIPLAACAACAVARRRAVLEAINVAAFGLTFLLALAVASQVLRSGAISLWNGFLYADALSALVILLNASVALVCAVYAVGYLREDERTGALDGEEGSHGAAAKLRMYYSLTPLLVFSLLLVALANNLGVMWAAIELTTLASVFLVTFYGKVTSLEAAWKYAMPGRAELVQPGPPCGGTGQDQHADGIHSGAARLRHQSGPGAHAHLETRRVQRSTRALGRHPGRRHVELRDLRPGPVLRADQPVPGAGVSRQPAAAARSFFHGDRGAVRPGAEELPAHAGVFHHRSGRHDGYRSRHRRQTRRFRADAAHDVSHRGQVAALPFRRQHLSMLQDRPFPETQGRCAARASADRRGLLPGHHGDCRVAAVQPLSE